MVAVTRHAARRADILENRGMAARPEQLSLDGVAPAADVADRVDSRRHRTVVSVTVVAGRCRDIADFRKGVPVDTLLVAC